MSVIQTPSLRFVRSSSLPSPFIFLFTLLAIGFSSCVSSPEYASPDGDNDGFLPETGDCDDHDASTYPDAMEICDQKDNDCNGYVDDILVPTDGIDEPPLSSILIYADQDGDGYGSDDNSYYACDLMDGYARTSGDCNDFDEQIHPDQDDTCDNVDSDCDGVIDEDPDRVWYPDEDFDGYGATEDAVQSCSRPTNTSSLDGDCDDSDADISPGAEDICDGIDNDCDGVVDNPVAWYEDNDGDGYGDSEEMSWSCMPPSDASVVDSGDCDDTDPSTYPGADEMCDGYDNDCDGSIDEELQTDLYLDQDGDGAGSPSLRTKGCREGDGYVFNALDCHDADPSLGPNDFDRGAPTMYYLDADGDGFGTEDEVSCIEGEGYVSTRGDCDDTDSNVYPGAEDVPGDGRDADCGGYDDAQPHVGLSTSSASDLQSAIEEAPDGSVIWVGPGSWSTGVLDFRGKDLRLRSTDGAAVTILDANGESRILQLSANESLESLVDGFTLQGGTNDKEGGALLIEGAAARMANLIVQDNHIGSRNAGARGGGLYAKDATIILSNTRFDANIAEVPSGWSVDAYGGALAAVNTYLTVEYSLFEGNAVEAAASESAVGGGGALSLESSSLQAQDVVFQDNRVSLEADMLEPTSHGGALYALESSLSLSRIRIFDHRDIDYGAGFFLSRSSYRFEHLEASNNEAGERGGALYVYDSDGDILQSIFEDNSASDGGAMAFYISAVFLSHVWMEHNVATYLGGGVHVEYGSLSATHAVAVSNSAERNGGCLYSTESSLFVTHSSFLSNEAALGGGMYVQGDSDCSIDAGILAWNMDYNFYQDGAACVLSSDSPSDLYAEDGNNHNLAETDGVLELPPDFVSYGGGEGGTDRNLHLARDSALIDRVTEDQDTDGSPADLGHYGGFDGGQWDLDADGFPDYYWPGAYDDVPEGEDQSDFDADDRKWDPT